ncbi:transcriptional regulator [Limosilactobacillus coleohominis DSM 14060]|nr:transcriptional regulator [Limosilactobacillus coleohominis DSM 14060]
MSEATIDKIQQTIQLLRAEHNNIHGSKEQQWIKSHLDDQELGKIILDLSIVSFHVLSALESGELTGIEISERIGVTRGGVTRAAKKLLQNQLIIAQKHPDNQRNIYYSLTDRGEKLALVHDEMHESIKKKVVTQLVAKYSEQDLQIVADFLNDLYELEKSIN